MKREILEVEEFFSKIAPYYDLIYNKRFKEKTNEEISFVQNFLPKGGKILDIACGTGRHSIELKRQGYDVIGIDISHEMLQIAKNKTKNLKFNIKFIQADAKQMPLLNQFVGAICLFSSFCHILTENDQQKVVSEIYRVLKKDGIAIIDVANWNWIKKEWDKKGKKIGIVPGTQRVTVHIEDRHKGNPLRTKLYHYTIEDLKKLFSIFPKVNFYGSFSLNDKIDVQNSERIILVAKKG